MLEIDESDLDLGVAHTILVELMDGRTLVYWVSAESKRAFYRFLAIDDVSGHRDEPGFIWLYIPLDRLVLINKSDIVRITFCFDAGIDPNPEYRDNFNMSPAGEQTKDPDDPGDPDDGEADDEEPYIPQLIVMHHRQWEVKNFMKGDAAKSEEYSGNISSYSSLEEGDVAGFDFDYSDIDEAWILTTTKYLRFMDDDGEENLMPLHNLSVIEIERRLLMSDETLELYLDRKTKKKSRTKKR